MLIEVFRHPQGWPAAARRTVTLVTTMSMVSLTHKYCKILIARLVQQN